MHRALVLNASYEPLGTVAARRAVVLILAAKADLVVSSDLVLHSERLAAQVPSVLRLRRHVRVPYPHHTPLSRRAVFVRDGHRCQYCGRRADSIDHVVPRSRGGRHSWDNVVAACRACNVRKADHLLHETGMELQTAPVVPLRWAWTLSAVSDVPSAWMPYLDPTAAMGMLDPQQSATQFA
jgi:5-methylcytosine-specific restriction endonuclease McrA